MLTWSLWIVCVLLFIVAIAAVTNILDEKVSGNHTVNNIGTLLILVCVISAPFILLDYLV